jgi:hypothetical protein
MEPAVKFLLYRGISWAYADHTIVRGQSLIYVARKKITLWSDSFCAARKYSRNIPINYMINVGWIGTGELGLRMTARIAVSSVSSFFQIERPNQKGLSGEP